jgi:hypothetical protein
MWYVDLHLLQSYHKAAQKHVALGTGLDADDGLALYIDQLQSSTLMVVKEQKRRKQAEW